MRSEHNSILEVPTPDPLGVYVPAPDPLGVYMPAHRGAHTDPLRVYVSILHTHVSHLEYSMSAPYRVPT